MRGSARRAFLVSVILLGSIVSGVSATGVLAPTTDSARTGTAEKELVQTGVFPTLVNVDLQLGADGCAAFSEDLTTPIATITDVTTRSFTATNPSCIRNVGTTATRIELRVLPGSIAFTDDACSPNEASAVPLGCSEDRLSDNIDFTLSPPVGSCPAFDQTSGLASIAGGRIWSTSEKLAPGTECFYSVLIKNVRPLTLADQTDSVRWQFEFRTL